MLNILKATKRIIERYIVNIQPLTSTLNINETTINVTSSRRFCLNDSIAVYDKNADEAYIRTVQSLPTNTSLVIDAPLNEDSNASPITSANGFIEKLIGNDRGQQSFIKGIYIGDLEVIGRVPAITVDGGSRSSKWLTIESTREDYEIKISVYVHADDREQQYELLLTMTKAIETALFRSFYPLVEPYSSTTLASDASSTDTLIHLTDPDFLQCNPGWIWIENVDHLKSNTVLEDLNNGIYRLSSSIGADFAVGDKIIVPSRHLFDVLPYSTEYGFINKGTMLKASQIKYRVSEEVRRFTPFVDNLTF